MIENVEENKDINEENQNNIVQTNNNTNDLYQHSNILVALRVRPLTQKELLLSNISTIQISSNKLVSITIPQEYNYTQDGSKYLNNEKNLEISKSKKIDYQFDLAFDENATQQEVYQYTTSSLIKNVLDGYNSTVFAYGATGSGKTYTMVGDGEKPGIMVRAISDLFTMVYQTNSEKQQYQIQISYVEIYNENIIDLLADGNSGKIDVLNDPQKGVVLMGTKFVTVKSASEAFKYLLQGNKTRKEDATNHNEHSSRSHAILQIFISNGMTEDNDEYYTNNNQVITFGKFILVDLAGSEKITSTQKPNSETHSINKSLLTLATCMNSLLSKNKQGFIPWRDSKLTRLLKDSLGGNSKVIMISNVSPSVLSLDETVYTIQFANRVKNIKVSAKRNVVVPEVKIEKYERAIESLKQEIEEVKREIAQKEEINNNMQIPIENEKEDDTMERYLTQIKNHFDEEIKVMTKITESEQELSQLKIDFFVLQNRPKKEITNEKIPSLQSKQGGIEKIQKVLTSYYNNLSILKGSRRPIQTLISKLLKEDENTNSTRGKLLLSAYKYYVGIIDNMKSGNRVALSINECKKKDKEIEVLTYQLKLRDQYIISAEEKIRQSKGDSSLTHNAKFIPSEEITHDPCCGRKEKNKKDEQSKSFSQDNSFLESKPNNIMNSTRISANRMYNAELLPLIKKKKNGGNNSSFLSTFKLAGTKRLQGSKSALDILSSNFKPIQKTSNTPKPIVIKKYTGNKSFSSGKINMGTASRNNQNSSSNQLVAGRQNNMLNNGNYYSAFPEIGKIYEKKVKTILCRNIIGRYKNSPYILKQEAMG